jgi:hypothetical protein
VGDGSWKGHCEEGILDLDALHPSADLATTYSPAS